MHPMIRRSGRRAVLLACAWLGACSVADNLTYAELVAEIDGIVQVEQSGASVRVGYRDRAEVSPWYMRSPLTWPLRWPLGWLFGIRHESELENPAGHVRELVEELPDEIGGDLDRALVAYLRALTLLQDDSSLGMQTTALDALLRIVETSGIALFQPGRGKFGQVADLTSIANARRDLLLMAPARRGTEPLDAVRRQSYRAALAALVAAPLPVREERQSLVRELAELWRAEFDDDLKAAVAEAARAAMTHATEGCLIETLRQRDARLGDLRLIALEHVRRHGGPAVVPLLLAVMAIPDDGSRRAMVFDQDLLVNLRLIHYCGQLRGDLALTAVRLPDREAWQTVAPAEFLANMALNTSDYFAPLRTPAVTGLCLSLGRPRIDQDLGWVREWLQQWQARP